MSNSLCLRNRHRVRRADLRLLRQITRALLKALPQVKTYELGVFVTGEAEMTRLNETYLRHAGSTDVITFDYGDPREPDRLAGDIFVCLDEAQLQARRFHTSWESEIVRYVVHGVLHLCGYEDQEARARKRMKRLENQLLGTLSGRFPLRRLGCPTRRG